MGVLKVKIEGQRVKYEVAKVIFDERDRSEQEGEYGKGRIVQVI